MLHYFYNTEKYPIKDDAREESCNKTLADEPEGQ